MEKINRPEEIILPTAVLYLDDLEEIAKLLASESQKLEITAGDYRIDDVGELGKLADQFPRGRFGDVEISGHRPHFVVSLRRIQGGKITIFDKSMAMHGVASKIERLFRRRFKFRFYWPVALIGYALVFWGNWLVFGTDSAAWKGWLTMSVGFYLVGTPRFKPKLTIHSRRNAEVKGFYERNRDTIWATIIGGIVAGLLVAAASPFINNLAAKAGTGG